MALRDDVLTELDRLIVEGKRDVDSFHMGEWGEYGSSLAEVDLQSFVASALAAIERVAGRDHELYRQLPAKPAKSLRNPGPDNSYPSALIGTLIALRNAVEAGLLVRLERRVRANVYDDFLVQAGELISGGYHVAAMVLTGGVLEDHLRKLCDARRLTWNGSGSLSKYNDLLRDVVFDQPTWRRIQSIADVRNQAAHGQGAKVKQEDVEDAHKFVGRVLTDHPA